MKNSIIGLYIAMTPIAVGCAIYTIDNSTDQKGTSNESNCELAGGLLYHESEGCIGPEVARGCTTMNCGGQSVISARDPNGSIWVFGTACHPTGWTMVNNPDSIRECVPRPPMCGQQSINDCNLAECMIISGWKLNWESECLEPMREVACGDTTGRNEPTFAQDNHSEHWMFPTTTIPADWSKSKRPQGFQDWPMCNEL